MKHLALAGCAHIHTPGFINTIKARSDVKIKSVWDHDLARAQKNAAELNATVILDFAQICSDPEISALIVCSETNRHEQLVLPAAAAKKHLFVEKPMGLGAADSYKMAAAIEQAGVLFQTGYFQRGDPKNLFLKNQIEAGNFGKITRIRGSNCHSGALGRWFDTDWRWMADPKIAGVGAFGDLGTHSLDIMLWLMGPVTSVTAQLDPGTATYPNCDETGEAILRFKNGAIGTLAAAWDDLANPVSLLISGTHAHAAVINDQLHYKSTRLSTFDGSHPLRQSELPPSLPAGLNSFLNALTGQPSAALVTAQEAAYRSAVMESIYTAAAQQMDNRLPRLNLHGWPPGLT